MVGRRSLPEPHLVAEMGMTINALPHTFVLSDKLLEGKFNVSQFPHLSYYLNNTRGRGRKRILVE